MRLTAFSDVSLRIMMLLSSLQEGENSRLRGSRRESEPLIITSQNLWRSSSIKGCLNLPGAIRWRPAFGDGSQSDRGAGTS